MIDDSRGFDASWRPNFEFTWVYNASTHGAKFGEIGGPSEQPIVDESFLDHIDAIWLSS